jgi:hypothetical protein
MRIQNLNVSQSAGNGAAAQSNGAADSTAAGAATGNDDDARSLEIALLKARIQHLELIVETARSLMGANQERLLRQLHEVPREIAALTSQMRRAEPPGNWLDAARAAGKRKDQS